MKNPMVTIIFIIFLSPVVFKFSNPSSLHDKSRYSRGGRYRKRGFNKTKTNHKMDDVWERLGRPRFVVAPMVDASELAWRMLSRRYGAQLCYTPMFHSNLFAKDARYRKEALITCKEDRPLIVQFCGNNAQNLLKAGKYAQDHCDAIDINLGCPQAIAKRGRYGAFLQDDWKLLHEIVSILHKGLRIPVTCKIRVFESIEKTVSYAKMLESAGCQMLTVHGRTREQKGPLTGIASWEHIQAVRENVKIPVIANGNIQCLADVYRCIKATNCNAVMTAEGSLYNPALFEGRNPPCWEIALEYLSLAEEYPCPKSFTRGHLFKLFQHCLTLPENSDIRDELGKASALEEFREMVVKLRDRYLPYHEGIQPWISMNTEDYNLQLPPWLCQVYVRIPPEEHKRKLEEKVHRNADFMFDQKENQDNGGLGKRARDNSTENGLSKKKLKKLQRRAASNFHGRRDIDICVKCPNPMGLKCEFKLCKTCCRDKCYMELCECPSHRLLLKRIISNLQQKQQYKNGNDGDKEIEDDINYDKDIKFNKTSELV